MGLKQKICKYCAAKPVWFFQPAVRAALGVIGAAIFYRYFASPKQSESKINGQVTNVYLTGKRGNKK
jgi:hypothetical protein